MKNIAVRVAAATILISLLCLVPPSALSQATTTTTVVKIPAADIPPTDLFPAIEACVGEAVAFSGNVNIVTHVTFTPSGGVHIVTNLNTQGVVATGLTTGTVYRQPGEGNFSLNTDVSALPMATTFVFNFSLIGPGQAPSFSLKELVHTTINANGQATVTINTTNVVCR